MRLRWTSLLSLAFLGALLLGAINCASAAPLTFVATGVVDSVDAALSGAFSVGDTFTMTYTFESTTAPRGGSNSTQAVYDAMLSDSFTLGSYSGSAAGVEEIQVDNNAPGDRYSPGSGVGDVVTGAPVAGMSLLDFFFRLDDSTETVFSDALILPTSVSLSSFTSNGFAVDFLDDGEAVHSVTGHLTSLVPEPTSISLGLVAAGGLLCIARRRLCK